MPTGSERRSGKGTRWREEPRPLGRTDVNLGGPGEMGGPARSAFSAAAPAAGSVAAGKVPGQEVEDVLNADITGQIDVGGEVGAGLA